MIKCIVSFLILALIQSARADLPAQGRIELKVPDMVSVNANSVLHLRDIVSLEADAIQSKIWEKLSGVAIDESVSEGRTITLDAKKISQIIRSQLTFSELKSISLRLPAETHLVGKKNFVNLSRIKTDVLSQLQKQCEDCSFEITDIRLPEKIEDFSDWTLSLPPGRIVRSPAAKILFATPQNGLKEYSLGLQVSALKPYLVATKRVEAGQPIQESDFTTRLLDVAVLSDFSPHSSELNGRKLNRTLMPGEVLYNSHLTKLFLVKAGQEAKGFFEEGSIKLELAVIPQTNGSLGDVISVKSILTQKTFSAVVLENGKVLIK